MPALPAAQGGSVPLEGGPAASGREKGPTGQALRLGSACRRPAGGQSLCSNACPGPTRAWLADAAGLSTRRAVCSLAPLPVLTRCCGASSARTLGRALWPLLCVL